MDFSGKKDKNIHPYQNLKAQPQKDLWTWPNTRLQASFNTTSGCTWPPAWVAEHLELLSARHSSTMGLRPGTWPGFKSIFLDDLSVEMMFRYISFCLLLMS